MGTGPYRIVDFKPGDLLRAALNPSYHRPNRPHFDTLEIKGGGDAISAARAVLQTAEYDYAWSLGVEDDVLQRLEASSAGRGRVDRVDSNNVNFVVLNVTDPNVEVDGQRSHPSTPIQREFNVDKANALLDTTGWKRGSDGLRAKDGRKARLVYQAAGNAPTQ